MKVYMLQDVEKVGMAGQVVKVSDGYASNFLFPKKLAIKVDENAMDFYKDKVVRQKISAEILTSKAAMLAERIKDLHLTIKERVHDNGKLYGSVGADEIVELLKSKDIAINRKQVEFEKTIKTVGDHNVIIKVSSKLKPQFVLKVVAAAEQKK